MVGFLGHANEQRWRRALETGHRTRPPSLPRGYCIRWTPGLEHTQNPRFRGGFRLWERF